MRKTQRAVLLGVSVLVVAALILISTINLKPTEAKGDTSDVLSVSSFNAEDMTDHLQLSLSIMNQNNVSVPVNATATITVVDNASAVLYAGTFAIEDSNFKNETTANGTELVTEWSLSYSIMNLSSAQGGQMKCSLSLTNSTWNLTAESNSVTIPPSLSIFKIYYTTMMPGDQEWAMIGKTIQAGVTYEPWASDMVQRGIGKVMLRSSDVWPDHPSYVLIMDKSWAEAHPDLAARMIKAHMDAELWMQAAMASPGSASYNYLVSKGVEISGFSSTVVAEALKHIKFTFELTDQTKSYVKTYVDGYMEEGLISLSDLQNRGYMNSTSFANSYIDGSYISLASTVTPSNGSLVNVSVGFVKGNLFMLPCAIALDKSIWGGYDAFHKYGIKAYLPAPGGYNTSALNAQALMKGNISVGYIAICPAILDRIQLGMRSVIVAQMAAEGTSLIVANNVFSFSDLAGKIIANPGPVTIQAIFMMTVAEEHGFILQPKT